MPGRSRKEAEEILQRVFWIQGNLPGYVNEIIIRKLQKAEGDCKFCFGIGDIIYIKSNSIITKPCICKIIKAKKEVIEQRFKESMIPDRYRNADIDKWVNCGEIEEHKKLNDGNFLYVKNYQVQIGRMLDMGHGLFITGSHGTGKTFLAAAIGNAVTKISKSVRFYTITKIIQIEINGWYKEEQQASMNDILQSDLLIIDDVDKVRKTKNQIELAIFDGLLRDRLQRRKSCILTSNRTLKDTSEDFGPHIYSMLLEQCQEVVFLGKDYRNVLSDKIKRDILDGNN